VTAAKVNGALWKLRDDGGCWVAKEAGGGNGGRYQAVAAEKMVQDRVADRNGGSGGGCWEVMVVTSDGGC
jgi:hypothetical protein